MSRRYGTFVSLVLDALDLDVPLLPLESPYDFIARKKKKWKKVQYQQTIWHMQRRGYLEIVEKNNKKFIRLTKKGHLEKLIQKAQIQVTKKWDGYWRVLIFDIPEKFHHLRDQFRWLLKRNHFVKLQASVFVSPYPLNREAITHLEESGLRDFVRLLKVKEMDNDVDLRKMFNFT